MSCMDGAGMKMPTGVCSRLSFPWCTYLKSCKHIQLLDSQGVDLQTHGSRMLAA
jgi:hypothetical protein